VDVEVGRKVAEDAGYRMLEGLGIFRERNIGDGVTGNWI